MKNYVCDMDSVRRYLQVEVTPWISSKHNMGFAFNRSTWRSIVRCSDHFCSYDDYNWDWSLQHVSQQCLRNKLHAMVVKGPRVFHIGEWYEHLIYMNWHSQRLDLVFHSSLLNF